MEKDAADYFSEYHGLDDSYSYRRSVRPNLTGGRRYKPHSYKDEQNQFEGVTRDGFFENIPQISYSPFVRHLSDLITLHHGAWQNRKQ